nr:Peptide chain release factor 1 like [Ipomoea batatas]
MTLQSTSRETALSPILEGDEIEVCIILEDLKDIIRQSEFQSISKLLVGWSGRRKRSKRVFTVASGAVVDSPSQSPPRVSHGDDENQTAERKVKKQAASSPATPLSLSLTESDEKQKQRSSRKRAKKKSREEWLSNIEELKQSKETLTQELENVMIYYNSLKAYNLKLKAMKEGELRRTSHEREEPKMEMTRRSVSSFGPSSLAQYNPQEQQPVALEMRSGLGACQTFMCELGQLDQRHSSYGLGMANHGVGPLGIPDLNLPAEQISGGTVDSPQPYDLQRLWVDPKARYAEARRNRKILNSIKIRKASGLPTLALANRR